MNAQSPIFGAQASPSNARFWDRIARRYADKPIADEASYRRKLSLSQAYFNPTMRILELGCGTGGTAIEHARHVARVVATDISREMVVIGQERAANAGVSNVDFVITSVEDFSAPEESFDAVLALSLLHLLDDPDAAIAKAHRLLKPGGLLITSTACLGDNMRWFGPVAKICSTLGLIPRVGIIARDELRRMIQQRNFAVIEEFEQGDGRTYFQIARRLV